MPSAAQAGKAKSITKSASKPKPVEKASKPEKVAEKPAEKPPEKAVKPIGTPVDYDTFLSKLTPKDRLNIERHLAAIDEQSTKSHSKLWKRFATAMMGMASHSAKANGQQSMQFYIQDGKYRMQVFALEDLRDGTIHIYAADAVDEAIKAGVLIKPKPTDEENDFRLPNSPEFLNVERMDGKVSNPAPFFKDMLGWNRRAVHIALPVMASDAQADATEKLMTLGARKVGAIQ